MAKIWIAVFLCMSGVLLQEHGIDLLKFRQNDYKLIPEWLELVRYNRKVIKYAKAVTYKYNRTTTAVNASFIANVDLNNDLEIVVQAYKFLSNEFRLFPIHFQLNACDALEKNIIGVGAYKNCGNFTGCPIKKNKLFHLCKFNVDESHFPPLIPSGRYMIELQGLLHGQDVGIVRLYGTIERQLAQK